MKWYHYLSIFFAGMFLANVVPHFVNRVSGDPFPTPFSDPPGKGLSSPTLNVVWALFNFVVGYFLLRISKATSANKMAWILFFISAAAMSIMLSMSFADKLK